MWKNPGAAYWRWAAAPFALVAVVWADGQSKASQCKPWDGSESGNDGTYWPCIIAIGGPDHGPDEDRCVPFYCPGLARGEGRPWLVHVSRLRMVPDAWRDALDFEDEVEFPYLPMSKL